MKKFLVLLLTLVSLTAFAQEPKIRLSSDSTKLNVGGTPIIKGDEFFVPVQLNGNGNTTSRALYFDFEFQNSAFDFVSVAHTGTGGNGGVLPGGSSITLSSYTYPGYSYAGNANNTTSNGNTNYNTSAYNFTQGGPKTIIRIYLNWATNSPLPYVSYGDVLRLRFKLKTTAVGESWDPIKMNFAASFNQSGTSGAALNEIPLTNVITVNPLAKKFFYAKLDLNGNLNASHVKVGFIKADNTGPLFTVTSNGTVNVVDSLITANTAYKIMTFINMDQLPGIMNSAVSVSDYTTADAEFISQNLNRTFGNLSIKTGAGYWAADVNSNNVFDGGDLTKLYAQAVGVNQLLVMPTGYVQGSGGFMSVPTFKAAHFDGLTTSTWATDASKTSQAVFTYTTQATSGNPFTVEIKYVLPGDINRSHSSQVVQNGTIQTNAIPSLKRSIANKLYASGPIMDRSESFINTSQNIPSISVNLKNTTVTSNTIEIPVNIDGANISALQFEFKYDPSKIKFESMKSTLPETWQIFANNVTGTIKFGGVDKDFKAPVKGSLTPFVLKFSTINSGLDINSLIKVTPAMDAADNKGSQLGINLNTDFIKLTGYNNF